MKWFLFLISILILVLACYSKKEVLPDASEFFLSDINRNNITLREADSLIFYLNYDDGITKYFDILESNEAPLIKKAAIRAIQDLRFQFPHLYQKIRWNNNVPLDTTQLGFYFKLRNKTDLISSAYLDSIIHSGSTQKQIKALIQKSLYSDLDITSSHDEMYRLIKKAYVMMEPYGFNNNIGIQIIHQLQNVSRYHRESLFGLSIINNLITELEKNDADKDIIHLLKINRGNLYIDLNEIELSIKEFDDIERIYQSQPCHDHLHRAYISQFYISLYNNAIRTDTLIPKLKKAYKCSDRISNMDRWLGDHTADDDIKLSLSYFDKAEFFELSTPFCDSGTLESIYYIQSLLYEKLNDYESALNAYYSRTKQERTVKLLLETEPYKNEWVVLERFASIYYNLWIDKNNPEDLNSAISLLLKAESSANTLMKSTDESTLLSYKYYQSKTYELLAKAYSDLYDLKTDHEYKNLMIESLSKRKNLLLITEILSQQYESNTPAVLRQQRKEIEKRVIEIKQKHQYNHPNLESLMWSLDSINNITLNYQESNDDYYKLSNRMPIDKVQTYLNNQSIISYNIIEDMLIIALINDDDTHIYKKQLNQNILDKLNQLAEWQSGLKTDLDQYTLLAEDCYQYLFPNEMIPLIHDELIIIPDGSLNYISFEALIEPSHRERNVDQPSFLIYKYKISTLPSEQLISSSDDILRLDKDSDIDVFCYSNKSSILNTQNTSLTELPWALEETRFITEKHKQAKLYSGSDATVSRFKKSLKSDNDLIHIATHGVSSSNSRYDVKLYFRNSDLSIDSLYGYELLDINIATKLIILTSCQSGTGTQFQNEGVYDLKRYLISQGAEKVIVSLWDLDDQSSYKIMKYFYSQETLDLRQAKLQFLVDYPDKSLPFYWAGLSN